MKKFAPFGEIKEDLSLNLMLLSSSLELISEILRRKHYKWIQGEGNMPSELKHLWRLEFATSEHSGPAIADVEEILETDWNAECSNIRQ